MCCLDYASAWHDLACTTAAVQPCLHHGIKRIMSSLLVAGLKRAFVCAGGAQDWCFDRDVLPYEAFATHAPPPPPDERTRRRIDVDVAAGELRRLGIL